jgi:hypothetical protein
LWLLSIGYLLQATLGGDFSLILFVKMPNKQESKSEGDGNTAAEPPDNDGDDDDSEFVEVDPTGRYGRVSVGMALLSGASCYVLLFLCPMLFYWACLFEDL